MRKMKELREACVEMADKNLIIAGEGNVSVRNNINSFSISPSGLECSKLRQDDFVEVDIKTGESFHHKFKPSSEFLMHSMIYSMREDVGCIIHTHPVYVQALTGAGHNLKPIFPDYYVFLGKNVPHLDYITVTTEDLAQEVSLSFVNKDVSGVVLKGHGIVTVGSTVKEAYYRTLMMEKQAEIQYKATMLNADFSFLSDEDLVNLDNLSSEEYRKNIVKE